MFHLWVPFWTIEHNKHLPLSSCAQQKYFSSHDSWYVRFLACFDRDMFQSKYARKVRPWSFSMLCRWRHWGKGMHLLPLQRHTRETSLSTWLPMPALCYLVGCTTPEDMSSNSPQFVLRTGSNFVPDILSSSSELRDIRLNFTFSMLHKWKSQHYCKCSVNSCTFSVWTFFRN